jgi:hypothetical protein
MKEDAWTAIQSTLTATRGPVRIIGNVKGKKNWFYLLARRAQHGDPEMAWHKMDAFDAVKAGVLAAEEIEAVRGRMPEHVFRELYMAEASDDEGNPSASTTSEPAFSRRQTVDRMSGAGISRSVGTGPSALRSTGRDAGWTSTASRNRGARPSRRTITHIPLAPWSEA